MKLRNAVIIIVVLLAGLLTTILTKKVVKTEYYDLQIEAAEKMIEASNAVKEKRLELGIEIDKKLDPLETGLIGEGAPLLGNSITTTLGILGAKKTSTNPNFASLIVKYFKELNLKKGDSVAVNFSSSFPALNIATMIALDLLELESVIHTSIGASTYGANIVEFTYLDMEKHLFESGIINRQTNLVSLGGEKDILDGITINDENFAESLYQRYISYDQLKISTSLKENVIYRYTNYKDNLTNIKVFVNVGGNWASQGEGYDLYPNGLNKLNSRPITKKSGVIDYFVNDHVPIINLLNIDELAKKNNMETNKDTPYKIGEGLQYYHVSYNKYFIVVTILLVYGLIYFDLYERNKIDLTGGLLINEKSSDWRI